MRRFSLFALFAVLLYGIPGALLAVRPVPQDQQGSAAAAAAWQSPARLQHFMTKTGGTLVINDQGVQFIPKKGSPLCWSYVEVQSFHLSAHRLDLETYQNRRWHLSGDRAFHFRLVNEVPPAVASTFARRVQKPVKNGRPEPSTSGFASIPARHRTFGGGTNGVLHFGDTGIDYVTVKGRGSRTWRWSDIQTIANPDAYQFRVQGYRETFEFELKQPMSRKLFDRLWDEVYGRGLTGLAYSEGRQQ